MKTIIKPRIIFLVTAIVTIFLSCAKSSGTTAKSNSNTVSTIAGSTTAGSANGIGSAACFTYPSSIAIGISGSMYVGDFGNNLVRSIDLGTTAVTTYAGIVSPGLLNGPALTAKFRGTANIVPDGNGNLFIADEENNVIREVTAAGNVVTIAGTGTAGYKDGPVAGAQFNYPEGMVIDASGNLYVADGHNNVVRKIILSSGAVSTYAGTGTAGFSNGAVASATFNDPYGLALDASGNIYVADVLNNCIRKITVTTGTVTTYAGTGTKGLSNGAAASATFNYPLGCIFDSFGNMFVADTYNNVIRKINATGTVTTLAGTGGQGSTDGPALSATFNFPIGLAINGNGIFVADTHNNTIRKITLGQ
jgi:hypothetical protein